MTVSSRSETVSLYLIQREKSNWEWTSPADYDPRARPWYQAAIAAGKTVLTEPYIDTVTKSLLMTIAVPAKTETGQVLGVAGGDLDLDTLVKTINALDFHGDGYAFLVNGNGQILVHPEAALVNKRLKKLTQTLRHG